MSVVCWLEGDRNHVGNFLSNSMILAFSSSCLRFIYRYNQLCLYDVSFPTDSFEFIYKLRMGVIVMAEAYIISSVLRGNPLS